MDLVFFSKTIQAFAIIPGGIGFPAAVQFLFPILEMNSWDTAQTDQKTQKEFTALLGADKNRIIVIYCGFVKCTRSHNGAFRAKKNVYRFPGGIYAWKGMGYPN